VIRDETKRVRQPAAWLLLCGVAISVFLGLLAMISDGFAAAVSGTLIVLAGGGTTGPTFADRAAIASHALTSLPLTAMAVAAVLLATHVGEPVRHARKITLYAVILQGIALLFGVLTWLVALGVPVTAATKLGFFLGGGLGVMVAAAGLFFSVVTLRSAQLQAATARAHARSAPPQATGRSAAAQSATGSATGYPGFGYGQPVAVQPATAQGYQGAGYQAGTGQQAFGQQTPDQQATAQTAQYQTSVEQYGAGTGYSFEQQSQAESPQSQAPGAYSQQAYGSYGHQAAQQQPYQGGFAGQAYGPGYDAGYGQHSYGQAGQGYGQYGQQSQQGYGQAAQPGADSYQSPGGGSYQSPGGESYQSPGGESYQLPGTDSYQQYYRQQAHQAPEQDPADNSQPGHGFDEGGARDHR
jgi:hypothetical protein